MPQPNYQLYYWPIAFRGCFVSYQFAYRNEPLSIESDLKEIQNLMALSPEKQDIPFTGPPLLVERDTGRVISQMPAIVLYMAEKLGLKPQDPFEEAMCMKVLMDCNDVLMELCCYNGSMMWERDSWINFRSKRLPRWMSVFEESLKRGYIGKEKANYADIGVFALFGNMIRCLPELENDLRSNAPGVYRLCKTIGDNPSLAKFIAQEESQYGKLYCGGQIEQSIRKMLEMDSQENS